MPAANIHKTTHLTKLRMDCALLSYADLSRRATGPPLVILPHTPGHPSTRLSVPVAQAGPYPDPWPPDQQTVAPGERFTLPHNTAGDTQSPGLTVTTLPRRHSGSGAPARPAHPAHPNSGALGGPPLPLSAWLLRHRPPSSLQRRPGLTPAPPHPQPAPRRGGGRQAAELTLREGREHDPLPGPGRSRPPAVAGSDAAPGPP